MGRHDPHYPRGPGNTRWFMRDGILMRARHNDEGWVTWVNQFHKDTWSDWDIESAMRKAYEEGMADQLEIIQATLGIK